MNIHRYLILFFSIFTISLSAQDKIDVWDFAAIEQDPTIYNNMISDDIINAWYDPSIEEGSIGNVLPSGWSVGDLSWTGGGNDRLRSNITSLTRYDNNIGNAQGYQGRIYVNSAANLDRFITMNLQEDDELTVFCRTDSGGEINVVYEDSPESQTEIHEVGLDVYEINFTAKFAGNYKLFDTKGKPSYFRIYREHAVYSDVTGTVDLSAAFGISSDYTIVFTNDDGKEYVASTVVDLYDVQLPINKTYSVSLANANGFIITSDKTFTPTEENVSFDITVEEVEVYELFGIVNGLGTEISELSLEFIADPTAGTIYKPIVDFDPGSKLYTVLLEPGVDYTITPTGVNDFRVVNEIIQIGTVSESFDIEFVLKDKFPVEIITDQLDETQRDELSLTFINVNEPGYLYYFEDINTVELRNGVYEVELAGLDAFPLELGLTSKLTVDGEATEKSLNLKPVTYWGFDDKDIISSDTVYKGLKLVGGLQNEIGKGHIAGGPGSEILVPVKVGVRITIHYYYTADFTIEGTDNYSTNSQSTGLIEEAIYNYLGTENGFVSILMGDGAGTTYITDISLSAPYGFKETLTVGNDKEFQTINAALDAVRRMERDNSERVIIEIDPGNYEEMLVIDMDSVTLRNVSPNPDIELTNSGVDISSNAVRVTSYYGHGYNYYSMGDDNKWNAEVLQVNKENGELSFENVGSGSTNNSYWNATVVVFADGFTAEHIIFENSFNQYISQKEADDVVVEWAVGSKGLRPTDVGNTDVQERAFVERAAAIAYVKGADKSILYKCRVIGRQDSFFGGDKCRVVMYKGSAMGAVDYIFGDMVAVFYKTELTMNTSDNGIDRSYITAAKHSSGRGYLFQQCHINSTIPGINTASEQPAKPGYFGRPWQANTSEAVFYLTKIDTSSFSIYSGESLINPIGWQNSLAGESPGMAEYGTMEQSGEDYSQDRALWATVLTDPVLSDGTEINTFNFTKGNDGWDPIPGLIEKDPTGVIQHEAVTQVDVKSKGTEIYITNVTSKTDINVYTLDGRLVLSKTTSADTHFSHENGFWIVDVHAEDGRKAFKVLLK